MSESWRFNPAVAPGAFKSWLMGGFEGSSFQFHDMRRVDPIVETHHDVNCEADYRMLRNLGVHTIRDALRWHDIEREPGQYDWRSFRRMLKAAHYAGSQVIWDLCHFGLPEHVDLLAPDFADRFADFAEAAARVHAEVSDAAPAWCPINEISYWAHAAGSEGFMHPSQRGFASAIKKQLVLAFCMATERLRHVDFRATIIATDPLIFVTERDAQSPEAAAETAHSFETFDMLLGCKSRELGGATDALDHIGLNFYAGNQWYASDRQPIGLGMPGYRPLHLLLQDVWERYHIPIVITETGAEGSSGPGWLRHVAAEVAIAERLGVAIRGLCIYPVMDYPAWVDARHCRTGLIVRDGAQRSVCPDMLRALRDIQRERNHTVARSVPRYKMVRAH